MIRKIMNVEIRFDSISISAPLWGFKKGANRSQLEKGLKINTTGETKNVEQCDRKIDMSEENLYFRGVLKSIRRA